MSADVERPELHIRELLGLRARLLSKWDDTDAALLIERLFDKFDARANGTDIERFNAETEAAVVPECKHVDCHKPATLLCRGRYPTCDIHCGYANPQPLATAQPSALIMAEGGDAEHLRDVAKCRRAANAQTAIVLARAQVHDSATHVAVERAALVEHIDELVRFTTGDTDGTAAWMRVICKHAKALRKLVAKGDGK
jgi:hypothetical protein